MVTRCDCSCHSHSVMRRTGDDEFGVDVADPIEAVLACPECIDLHCPALSGRPPEIEKREFIHPETFNICWDPADDEGGE